VKLQIRHRLRIDRSIAAVAHDQRQRRGSALDATHEPPEAGGALVELHPFGGERDRVIDRYQEDREQQQTALFTFVVV